MEDKNRNGISQTFGKYADNATYGAKDGYNKVREVKNVTSDMWAPISAGTPTEKKVTEAKSTQPKKQLPQQQAKRNSNKNRPISEGREQTPAPKKKKDAGSKGRSNNAAEEKKKSSRKTESGAKKKTASVSRTPKGKPVSSSDARKQNIKNQQNTKTSDKTQQQNTKKIRHQQQVNKENQHYDLDRKGGISHDESSKRRAAAKRKKRRLRSIITVILFMVFAAAFLGIYSYTKGAPIANIIIEGESKYKNEKIIECAEIYEGLNMMSLREKKLNEKITAELPFIHSVELSRKLPDTVTLTVTPTKEKYLIVNDKGYICVDEHEKVVSAKKMKLQEGSYKISGFEPQQSVVGEKYEPSDANKEKYKLIKQMISAMEKGGVIKSAVINLEDMSDIQVLYNGNVMIYLGECDDLDNQITLAGNVIKDAVTNSQTGYIDLRYDGRAFFNEGTMEIN